MVQHSIVSLFGALALGWPMESLDVVYHTFLFAQLWASEPCPGAMCSDHDICGWPKQLLILASSVFFRREFTFVDTGGSAWASWWVIMSAFVCACLCPFASQLTCWVLEVWNLMHEALRVGETWSCRWPWTKTGPLRSPSILTHQWSGLGDLFPTVDSPHSRTPFSQLFNHRI